MIQCAETNQKWIENEHFSIKTLSVLIFNESKLRYARALRNFFYLFFFFLMHSKVNLRISASIFYKSTGPANIKSATFNTVL